MSSSSEPISAISERRRLMCTLAQISFRTALVRSKVHVMLYSPYGKGTHEGHQDQEAIRGDRRGAYARSERGSRRHHGVRAEGSRKEASAQAQEIGRRLLSSLNPFERTVS